MYMRPGIRNSFRIYYIPKHGQDETCMTERNPDIRAGLQASFTLPADKRLRPDIRKDLHTLRVDHHERAGQARGLREQGREQIFA